ncbi:S1C family serine protease [Clostridium ljungdahlii]|uniref:Serine protease Do-like HtrB n=1 Tax=Clostridium ljungdahlii TaxID=1538 RepID=A0A168LRU6_9CLOT|nr:trypsin-like peptidase domain-containing protein [Clostridium ljungdahlii]OAA83611.1 Serine protease Do-like HtrB [Clostridium ljungdahlii]
MGNFNNKYDTSEISLKTKFKDKLKRSKKFMSYIAVGLVCSILGGSISIAGALYFVPKLGMFKSTPLYQNLAFQNTGSEKSSTISASPVSTVKGGLTVSEIAKKVGPAVVGVSIKTASQSSDIFGFSGNSQSDESQSNGSSSDSQDDGMGSGIIINEDGYILTNYHVIESAEKVSVIFNNKKEATAKVVNYDAGLDLAIIKVTTNEKMPAVAELGDSKNLQVGDSVVAIGNPLGKELLGTVTTGVISATNRDIKVGNNTQDYLQTDAAINPGNSGGALVNSAGQVIGINSAKIGGSGVEGIGFAIPIDTVKPKLSGLLKPILKLGIAGRDINSQLSQAYNVPEGVYVAEVQEFSAAEKCGLKVGDVIQKFDGKSVKSISDINDIKATHKSGDTVEIVVNRNGSNKTLNLTLTE